MKKKIINLLIIIIILLCCSCKKKEVIYYCYSLTDDKKVIDKVKELLYDDYDLDYRKCYGFDYLDRMKIGKPFIWLFNDENEYKWNVMTWIDGQVAYIFCGDENGNVWRTQYIHWYANYYYCFAFDEMHVYSKTYLEDIAPGWYKYRHLTTKNQPMYLYTMSNQYLRSKIYIIIGDYAYNIDDSNDIRRKDDLPGIENVDLSNAHVNAVTMDNW